MTWPWAVAAAVAGLVGIDRIALWAESRGWIYWRRRKPSPGAASGMFGELVEMFEPSHRHVIEERQRQEADVVQSETGEPASPEDPERRGSPG